MMAARKTRTLRDMNPESMTISQHLSDLPAALIAAAPMLRSAPPDVASSFTATVPVMGLQASSLAGFATLLSRHGLRAEVTAEDGQATFTFTRREDTDVTR
ncbi:MAG TPA: hypothetical protein VMT90_07765 [Dehalococcoidia bacterium]|jgi:hypothetical protein|nr:hypothetical protein [Dehalococcoidia bacterium]